MFFNSVNAAVETLSFLLTNGVISKCTFTSILSIEKVKFISWLAESLLSMLLHCTEA